MYRRKPTGPRPRKLDGAQEARLIALACGPAPEGCTRWTLKLLAHRMVELEVVSSLSAECVRTTQKNELKPWLRKQWVIPPEANAEFVCAMEDTLEVYARPYDPLRPQVCLDEYSKQRVAETRPPWPAEPGQLERFDYGYERCGTAHLFMLFEPLAGCRHVKVRERRRAVDFAEVIRDLVDRHYSGAEKIVLVMDNLNTHKRASLYQAFPADEARRLIERLEIHHTPKHGSGLNLAEIELSALATQCLDRRIADLDTLTREVAAWQDSCHTAGGTVNWRFTADEARIKLQRLYPSIERG